MKHGILTLALAITLVGHVFSQSSFMLNLYQDADPVQGAVTTSNGDQVFLLSTASNRLLWRSDATGQALWAQQVPDSLTKTHLLPGPNNDIYFIGTRTVRSYPTPWTDDDTLWEYLSVKHLDEDGNLLWAKDLNLMHVIPYESFIGVAQVKGILLNDGRLAVALHMYGNTYPNLLHLFIFEPLGNLVLSVAYGTANYPEWPVGLWGHHYLYPDRCSWAMLNDGSFVMTTHEYPSPIVYALHFDSQFNNDWVKKYTYLNSFFLNCGSNVAAASAGGFSYFFNGGPSNSTAIRLLAAADGSLVNRSLYTSSGLLASSLMQCSDANGNLILTGMSSTRPYLLRTAPDGSLISSQHAPSWVNGEFGYRILPRAVADSPDGIVANFTLRRQHQIFNYVDYFAASATISEADPGCLFTPLAVDQHVVPDSLVALESMTTIPRLPLSPLVTTGNAFAGVSPLSTLDLCAQVVEVPEMLPATTCMPLNSIASAGNPLRFNCATASGFMLIDMRGAIIRHYAKNMNGEGRALSVDGIAPGLYALVALSDTIGAPQSMKVIVE